MSKFKLSKPSPGGDKWDKQAHLDHLHLFIADEFAVEEIADQFNAGKTTRRVHVDHVVCVDDRELWADLMVYGAALVPRLDGCETNIVVGRLGQGLASKDGRNAPWTLDDPTDGDLETAERFLERYATTLPSGGVVLDVKQILLERVQQRAILMADDVPFADHLDAALADYAGYINTLCAVIIDCQARGNTTGVELALVLLEGEVLSLVTETN